jgi:Flp pilus assembly protein TadB
LPVVSYQFRESKNLPRESILKTDNRELKTAIIVVLSMKCRNCGTEIAANALICYRCGTAVEELPPVRPAESKQGLAGLIGPLLMVVVLLGAALVATRMFVPELPRAIVWIVFVLALLLAGWWIARRRNRLRRRSLK